MDRKKHLIKELQQFAQMIARDYPIKKIILFGSQATGKTHQEGIEIKASLKNGS